MKISICIGTYKRPLLLQRLLASIRAQRVGGDVEIETIVVDNDEHESGARTCQEFLDLAIVYIKEPMRGIARVRNRCLDQASGELIAFLDDDERASEEWLATLLGAMRRYGADVISGPVLVEYDEAAPAWVKECGAYEHSRYQSGLEIPVCGTCNVLMTRAIVSSGMLRFDETIGLGGGEDTDFFKRLVDAGGRIVWEDKAIVYEYLPLERSTMVWLVQRKYHNGVVQGRHIRRWGSTKQWIVLMVREVSVGLTAVVVCGPALVVSTTLGVKWLVRASRAIGRLMGSCGITYEEYKHFPGPDHAMK